MRFLPALGLATVLVSAQQHPSFAGKWTYDSDATLKMAQAAGRVASAVFSTDFVAEQTATALTLHISFNGQVVDATYKLDGTESRNISPGDIPVVSKASWDGDKLVIVTTSTAGSDAHTVETRRVLWLAADGALVIDRSGTPAIEVADSRSVYVKK